MIYVQLFVKNEKNTVENKYYVYNKLKLIRNQSFFFHFEFQIQSHETNARNIYRMNPAVSTTYPLDFRNVNKNFGNLLHGLLLFSNNRSRDF